ncbi:MAG: PQQ-binding-like beta-propeller repeat protein [Opitutae bacterium]|jgi:outer membrane protein assembly factor BamB|nr:PQQ-binding-like beta-propeller repeat protein [Opitutae bacterium]
MNFKFPYLVLLSCLFVTLALGSHHKKSASADWPLWRGPGQNGLAATGQNLPHEWSDSKNVIWKTEIPGRGHGSPVVFGDQVILPTSDEKKKTQSVLCLDRETGKLLWTTQIHEGGFMRLNKKGTHASGSLACDGKRLYVNFLNAGAAHTTALSMDGKILWQTKITNYVVHQAYASSPALHGDNLLLVAADNKKNGALACLDRTTGKIIWKVGRPKKPNYASPVIYELNGRQQLIMTGCDLVSSYNPLTGEKLWEIKGATTECVTTTVTDGVHVYSSGGYPKNHVSAIRADGSGKVAWSNNIRVYVPSMIVNKGYLYGIADAGIAYCWKSDTGEEIWKGRLGGTFSASLTLADGNLYAANEAGDCFVFEASSKEFKLLAKNKLGDEIFASPVICGKRLFQRTAHRSGSERQEFLYCIGKK